ncbi:MULTISPECIES: glycosyltransferase [Sorangium]|uniref:Glycogen synthase n=1 Tax=Sorangium cellulosum TaxID=56 RepID=A0A4P2R571_SORCE|nr:MULTISPECIES: glycosyltransferase [Sorangium]AUX38260.1 glycogen synthase [Sorangium cellulosum]WCQ97549.1 glycosyltransferase [Sorangium sp. Soce836]
MSGAPEVRPAGGEGSRAAPGQPAKVAHVVLSLNVGGLERVVLRLLERTARDRFAPIVCALEEPGALAEELARLGVPLVVLPRRPGLDPGLPVRLSAWLRREGIRLVHTHNPGPHLYGALAAGLARAASLPGGGGPRVIHTKHGRNYPKQRRKVLVNRLAAALTDRVVAVSDDARAVTLEVERVDPAKVVTILNGVDTDVFRPGDAGAARARLGVPTSGYHVGCVARLSPEKDHATLLAAFARLRGVRPDAHLTLIGDGPLRPALEEQAARLGLGGAVTFTGTRGDVAELLPAFDVFALASLTEGISLTLIEAAAAGLPIVATRVGGNPEILEEGSTGLLVSPGAPEPLAAALEAVAVREDRAAMGERGRARVVERFGVDQMVRAYEELYAEVLGG